ncbi:serine hydrolase family protein [Candidatus Berkelbacteria bacterium]|nr:serine hydrolase family protein [Candidatus Berkelbacteria bacterium]
MKRVIIVHGWEGFPEEGWFPWLKRELEQRGFHVDVPAMPVPDEPTIERWVPYLASVVGTPDEDTYLIGHSMGVRAIIHYLNTVPPDTKVGGVVSVAGAMILRNLEPEEEPIFKPWFAVPLDYAAIRALAGTIVAVFSDDDPWVPLEQNKQFWADQLGAEVVVLDNRGHFSGSDGVIELPEVRDAVLKMVGEE